MKWELKIKKVENGFVVGYEEELATETKTNFVNDVSSTEINETVFEYKKTDENDTDLETVEDLLYHILEYFGVNYSKHNKRNIQIKIVETKNG